MIRYRDFVPRMLESPGLFRPGSRFVVVFRRFDTKVALPNEEGRPRRCLVRGS